MFYRIAATPYSPKGRQPNCNKLGVYAMEAGRGEDVREWTHCAACGTGYAVEDGPRCDCTSEQVGAALDRWRNPKEFSNRQERRANEKRETVRLREEVRRLKAKLARVRA